MNPEAVINLGRLALAFGRVNRITYHEDGVTPESDTTHTVMLGLLACALTAGHPRLRTGLVVQYALVHDLVEAYAGDTNTLGGLTDAARADKKAREHAAQDRIRVEFADTMPWLVDTLDAYEEQVTMEARFVRALDKLLPKITHILNECVTLREHGIDPERQAARYAQQRQEIAAYASDFPELLDLHAQLVDRVLNIYRPAAVA